MHPPYLILTDNDDTEIANVYIFEGHYTSGGSYKCYRFESADGKWILTNKKSDKPVLYVSFVIVFAILIFALIKTGDLSLQSLLVCAFILVFLIIFVKLCFAYARYRAERIFKMLLEKKDE